MFLFKHRRNWKYFKVVFISFYVFTNFAKLPVRTFVFLFEWFSKMHPMFIRKWKKTILLITNTKIGIYKKN